MQIQHLYLKNIGQFKELRMDFAPTDEVASNVTVFIADNGGGKTTIVKSLATVLSWLVNRIRTKNSSGTPIPLEVIRNNAPSACVDISVTNANKNFKWSLARTQKGKKGEHTSALEGCTKLADFFKMHLTENAESSVPLLAFYSVERVVVDIPLRIGKRHTFGQIDGYDESLTSGVDFRRFFEWFREREDKENENSMSPEIEQKIENALNNSDHTSLWDFLKEMKASSRDKQLTAVRSAIKNFMPGFDNLRVRRSPLRMVIDKGEQKLNVLQLSQGEKSLMALVGDIARRLAIMNPNLDNPLEGAGVILIDEIDMYLHPKWQRSIIANLIHTFPNCQFILTTHSPIVISDYKHILLYSIGNDSKLYKQQSQYGKDVNMVLLDIMDANIRNKQVTDKINQITTHIHYNELKQAKEMLSELENDLSGSHMDIQTAKILLKKQEIRNAKNK